MLYTVYKVLNLLTGEFYIGVHKTDNPDDDYLGSGELIRAQVAQHGRENFSKEILASFRERRDAYQLEADLVDPLLGTPGCLNLHPGGRGGFGFINRIGRKHLVTPEGLAAGGRARFKSLTPDEVQTYMANMRQLGNARGLTYARAEHLARLSRAWRGQKHTPETLELFRAGRAGAGNPSYGTAWIIHPATLETRKVPSNEVGVWEEQGWLKGRALPAPVPLTPPPPQCPRCGCLKTPETFYKNKARVDGLDVMCKNCRKAQNNLSYTRSKVG